MSRAVALSSLLALFLLACANVDQSRSPQPPDARLPNGDAGAQRDAGACLPTCMDNTCGSDGCGGLCGTCGADDYCADGLCEARPVSCGDAMCTDAETCRNCPADCGTCCGDGTCRPEHEETCGTCPIDCGCPHGEACAMGQGICEPVCSPLCGAAVCGDDGCGGACGSCAAREACVAGQCQADPQCGDGFCDAPESCAGCLEDCPCAAICDAQGACVDCVPHCDGRVCGDDGCGGACGDCGADEDCDDGRCLARCQPDCTGRACGDDGCGGTCGACDGADACTPAGACVANCQPDCSGQICGNDGCGGSCGDCGGPQICDAGRCVLDCPGDCGPLNAATCDADAARVCAADPERPGCTTWSRRTPCGPDRACDIDTCDGLCLQPELLVLLDGAAGAYASEALAALAGTRGPALRLGLRALPGPAGDCTPGALIPPGQATAERIAAQPLAGGGAAPIAASFEQVVAAFGDAHEGEAVLLISARPEGCATDDAVIAAVHTLRLRNVRTYAVALPGADDALLNRVVRAGGTTAMGVVPAADLGSLNTALSRVLNNLDACQCAPDDARCAADTYQICQPDGLRWQGLENCAHGCDTDRCNPLCRPNEDTRCAGETMQRCAAGGDAFVDDTPCAFGCAQGRCNPVCRPGAPGCQGTDVVTCNAAGTGFEIATACALDCDHETVACRRETPCEPGAQRCALEGLLQCTADGRGWTVAEACPGRCNPSVAACPQIRDGSLRLVGDHFGEGRVELFYDAWWGTVCSDGFDATAADLACRQAGFDGSEGVIAGDPGAGRIWLDDLNCAPNAVDLDACQHSAIGDHNCDPSQDISVRCTWAAEATPTEHCAADQHVTWRADGSRITTACANGCDVAGLRCEGNPLPACEVIASRTCEATDAHLCTAHGEQTRPCADACLPGRGQCTPEAAGALRVADDGHLEQRTDGGWRAVCGDDFGLAAQADACDQLGLVPDGAPGQQPHAGPWLSPCPANQAAVPHCRSPRPGLTLCEGDGRVVYGEDNRWHPQACPAACEPITGRCAGDAPDAIHFCRVQHPWQANVSVGEEWLSFGRVYEAGLTDRTNRTDPASRLIAEVGYGPTGTQPTDATWRWFEGQPNLEFDGDVANERDNDEYMHALRINQAGDYDLAWRFSLDGGRTWSTCDGQPAGNSDGYQPEWAGQIHVE
jgi:hypothetical protein